MSNFQGPTSRGTWINLCTMIILALGTAGAVFVYASGMISDLQVVKSQVADIRSDIHELKVELVKLTLQHKISNP